MNTVATTDVAIDEDLPTVLALESIKAPSLFSSGEDAMRLQALLKDSLLHETLLDVRGKLLPASCSPHSLSLSLSPLFLILSLSSRSLSLSLSFFFLSFSLIFSLHLSFSLFDDSNQDVPSFIPTISLFNRLYTRSPNCSISFSFYATARA